MERDGLSGDQLVRAVKRVGWTICLVVAACGDGSTGPGTGFFRIEPASATVELGFHQHFRVVSSIGGQVDGIFTIWASSDPSVLTIDEDGLATAKSPGSVEITASVPDGSASVRGGVAVPVLQFRTVSAGSHHTCGITERGPTYCWGNNDSGRVGDGTSGEDRLAPVPMGGSIGFEGISAGNAHTCGVAEDGTYCWGEGLGGKLGDGSGDGHLAPHPVQGPSFVSIHAGAQSTCALTSSGKAWCWGDNRYGSVGDGTNQQRTTPVRVTGDLTFDEISTGGSHTCGLTADGAASCWGRGGQGQLGEDKTIDRSSPVPVYAGLYGDLRFQSISAGRSHTCGVSTDGLAYCWGNNRRGQLGTGTPEDEWIPTPVDTDLLFQSLVAAGSHTCGLTTEGTAHCWGRNFTGSLGQPPNEVLESNVPVPVIGGHVFHWITSRRGHTCGLATDDIVYCWGANPFGQLGIGEYSVGSYEPVPIFGQR